MRRADHNKYVTTYSEYEEDISNMLCANEPGSVIAIDPRGDLVLRGYQGSHPSCEILLIPEPNRCDVLPTGKRYDFGYIANTLEHLETSRATSLIAGLRDLHTRELCLVAPVGSTSREHCSHWQTTDFTALGLRFVTRYHRKDHDLEMFSFNITTYKHTPDWLNPDHWANPEHWDKERW